MKFKLFFKSLGNKQLEYNYPLAHVESDNIQEVVVVADFICRDMNIPVHQLGVELDMKTDYVRERTSTTGIFESKKLFTNNTGRH